MAAHDTLARRGEELAESYLKGKGLEIVDRDWRCELGEIPLVAREGTELVFCTVITRAGLGYGHPLEAITAVKLARLRRMAAAWRLAHPDDPATGIRVDAIAVIAPAAGGAQLEHLTRVF